MLATALTRIVSSGQLYRIFTEREITDIQQYAQFFNPQMEQFIAGRINQLKEVMDIAEAHDLANYLDGQVRQGIAALTTISQKR